MPNSNTPDSASSTPGSTATDQSDADADTAETAWADLGSSVFPTHVLLAVRVCEQAQLGDPHGLAVKQQLEHDPRFGYDEINHGRLYPTLDDLADAARRERPHRRPHQQLRHTERGQQFLADIAGLVVDVVGDPLDGEVAEP